MDGKNQEREKRTGEENKKYRTCTEREKKNKMTETAQRKACELRLS